MTDTDQPPDDQAATQAQARALRDQARAGGLRFEAYLPGSLADWLLDLVERGVFTDPAEAVFVILGEHRELEPHRDLRTELLRRSLQAAADDPRPGIPHNQVEADLKRFFLEPRPQPAHWLKART